LIKTSDVRLRLVNAMRLHRDTFWPGRQWAVTGYGIQAVHQKLDQKFDVEAPRIFQDGLAGPMQSEPWFDGEDFAEATGQQALPLICPTAFP
jgi:hypothetical protein